MIYLLVGYMWLYIHRPFEVWLLLGNIHIERIYMVIMILYWLFFVEKSWIRNGINRGVTAMVIAITVTTLLGKHYGFDSEFIQNWYKIVIFYLILASSVNSIRDFKILIISFVLIMGLFELHSFYEYICGRGVYRMGTWRMIGVGKALSDPNSFAASINYGIPFLLPCLVLANTKLKKTFLFALFVLAIICILLTGSRTGLTALGLLLLWVTITSKYRYKIIPLLVILVYITWINLSLELQNRYLTLVNPQKGPANAQESADSRYEFTKIAYEIWLNNPVFGIGPNGFRIESNTGMAVHTLYGELLSEVGLVGMTALCILIANFFKNYFISKSTYRKNKHCSDVLFCHYVVIASTMSIFQLLFLGLGGHNLFRFTWIWYGAFSLLAIKFLIEFEFKKA